MRYLLITYARKPGGQIDEQVGFSSAVRTRDLQTCNVIMDFKEQKVIKCVIEGSVLPTSYEKMYDYYNRVYPQIIEQLDLANDIRFEGKPKNDPTRAA